MASKNRKKPAKKIQAGRSLRSSGPPPGVGDIFSATSGRYWKGVAKDPNAVDTQGAASTTEPLKTTEPKPSCKVAFRWTENGLIKARQIPVTLSVAIEQPGPLGDAAGGGDPLPDAITDLPTTNPPVCQENTTAPEDPGIVANMEMELDDGDIDIYGEPKPQESGENHSPTERTLIQDPPGGPLNVKRVPGESPPARETLRIDEYSNTMYWQFAPYLEPEFCSALEALYRPNNEGLYNIYAEDLMDVRTSLERRVFNNRPSPQLASNDGETATTHTFGAWERSIITHLLSYCTFRGLDSIEEVSSSDSEDSDVGYNEDNLSDEDEPVSMVKSKRANRGKRKKKQDAVDTHPGSEISEERTPYHSKGAQLTDEDLQFANDLWDDVINPACIAFENRTGKSAEAMREAVAGVFAKRREPTTWNRWQTLWWKGVKVRDGTHHKQLGVQCGLEYQEKMDEFNTREELDAWRCTLADDVARLDGLDTQESAARKVIDFEDELVKVSSSAARDNIHVLFFVCAINPHSQQAQAMSGIGVGSNEMKSVLVDGRQLESLSLMLNDLKLKVANVELENRKAGKLPPAFGSGCMLELPQLTRPERLDPHMNYTLFEHDNAPGPSDSIRPKARKPTTSRSRKALHTNDSGNPNRSNQITVKTLDQLSRLPVDSPLTAPVSQVGLPMPGWEPLHIFQLFVVLLEPPSNLVPDEIPGLRDYLTKLTVEMTTLSKNGPRTIASHCWWALLMLCSEDHTPCNRAQWVPVLMMLKVAKKRLINWCPSVPFPIGGGFPTKRGELRSMATMFLNPDPVRRLRLVPIKGPITADTPVIVGPAIPGSDCYGCTTTKIRVPVDPSIVTRWYKRPGAVNAHDPTQSAITAPTTAPTAFHTTSASSGAISHDTANVGLLPTARGFRGPSTNPLDLGHSMYPPYDSSYQSPVLSDGAFASDAAAGLYQDDVQHPPFGMLPTLRSTTTTSIHPSNMNMFNPQHYRPNFVSSPPTMSQRRAPRPLPLHDERNKRRKVDEHPVDRRGAASSSRRHESLSLEEHRRTLYTELEGEGLR